MTERPLAGLRSRGRMLAAIAGGKLAAAATRRLGRGGTSLPGLVAERIDPSLLARVADQLGWGCVLVTGTNGKTTTARMLASIAAAAGLRVVHNRSGSNLRRGLVATAVEAAGLGGGLAHAHDAIGVFEIDEATLPLVLPALSPRALIFTNLFRDQLDRFGEVDSILAIWRLALARLDSDATLVINADDPSVAGLSEGWRGSHVSYGVDDLRQVGPREHAADSRWCSICGSEYQYSALYFGHIGIWCCPGCERKRPAPNVYATEVETMTGAGSSVVAETPGGSLQLDVPLQGLYNVYNALAAAAGAIACGLPSSAIASGLAATDAAFGRQERLEVHGRDVRILLCKNPAGTNQVLRLLLADPGPTYLLMVLNDDIADGHDISWIWDVDYELLAGRVDRALVSGRRAEDLALRLKYAGLEAALVVEPDPRRAVLRALALTPDGSCLSVLPTYTAMLTVREQLAELAGRPHFWED